MGDEDIWSMIITSTAMASVLVAVIQLVLPRIFKKHDDKDAVMTELIDIKKSLKKTDYESRLNDSQTHLLIMINHYPRETAAIMTEAERYFIELGGNSWVYDIVHTWAKNNGVDISYISKVHNKNLEKQKEQE